MSDVVYTHFYSLAERAIALSACLRSLTGTPASGTATARATGSNTPISLRQFAFPVVTGAGGVQGIDWQAPFWVTAGATVSAGGTSVAIESVFGGERGNLSAGMELALFPTVDGLERTMVVNADLTGGANEPSPLGLRSVTWIEAPVGGSLGEELVRQAQAQTPSAIVVWNGSPAEEPSGQASAIVRDRWQVVVAVSREDGHHVRGYAALYLVGIITALLRGRSTIEGAVVSTPGIKILARNRLVAGPTLYAYAIDIETAIGELGVYPEEQAVADATPALALQRFDFPTLASETGAHPGPLQVVSDARYPLT